jgi:hypothetical protein
MNGFHVRVAGRLRRGSTDADGPSNARRRPCDLLRNNVPNEAHLLDCSILTSPGEQNGVRDRLGYSLAETFASPVVGPEVLAGINSAQSRLLSSR